MTSSQTSYPYLLEVENLCTQFINRQGQILRAVDQVSFRLGAGQILGLVGESGSGKTITGQSILGLVPSPGRIVAGRVMFKGLDLRTLDEESLRDIRGNRIAMIFQDPMMTLNPVLRIDTQMIEAIRAHRPISDSAAREEARLALARVGIPSPDERLLAYPHQFSGGMRQRVVIAIALLNHPDLIIADEPTTALDVTIQGQILSEMQTLCAESGTSMIWITHDLSVVAGLADWVCVMYAGRVVESGTVARVLDGAHHPYTRGLIQSIPSVQQNRSRWQQIEGTAPILGRLPPGCAFSPRCPEAQEQCHREAPLLGTFSASPPPIPLASQKSLITSELLPEHQLACFYPHASPLYTD